MKRDRGCASDGYRFRMIVQRDLTPMEISHGDAIVTCGSQRIPIFHLTPKGFKIFHPQRLWMQGAEMWAPTLLEDPDMDVYHTFKRKPPPWEDELTPPRDDEPLYEYMLKREFRDVNRLLLLKQEVIHRAFCRSFQNAVLHQKQLVCPFAKGGCTAAVPSCGAIKNLENVPQKGCALREWAALPLQNLQLDCIRWS